MTKRPPVPITWAKFPPSAIPESTATGTDGMLTVLAADPGLELVPSVWQTPEQAAEFQEALRKLHQKEEVS